MKTSIRIILLLICLLPVIVKAEVNLYLFYGDGCPHCKAEQEYLDGLQTKFGDDLKINKFEVWYDDKNANLLEKVRKTFDSSAKGVPYTVIGEIGISGYNEATASNIETQISRELKNPAQDVVQKIINGEKVTINSEKQNTKKKEISSEFDIPILGKIDARGISLPVVATAIGLADGFNPCAMWVLLFLISMLLTMENKKRRITLGIIFLVTSALVYLLFMLAWLGIAITITQQMFLRSLIGIFAASVGIYNIYKFKKTKDSGCDIVNDTKRKKIFSKIKNVIKEKNFILAGLGIIVLAFTVNLIELACSAGLPLVFTSILALNDLSVYEYALNIGIYILFFMIDDIIVFIIAMKTMEVTGISTKYTKWSHLIGGLLMLILGILLIFFPKLIMFGF